MLNPGTKASTTYKNLKEAGDDWNSGESVFIRISQLELYNYLAFEITTQADAICGICFSLGPEPKFNYRYTLVWADFYTILVGHIG